MKKKTLITTIIGASSDIRNRWKGHKHDLINNLHNNSKLQNDWNN